MVQGLQLAVGRLAVGSGLSQVPWEAGPAPFQARVCLGISFLWGDGGIWRKRPGVSHRSRSSK